MIEQARKPGNAVRSPGPSPSPFCDDSKDACIAWCINEGYATGVCYGGGGGVCQSPCSEEAQGGRSGAGGEASQGSRISRTKISNVPFPIPEETQMLLLFSLATAKLTRNMSRFITMSLHEFTVLQMASRMRGRTCISARQGRSIRFFLEVFV